MLNFGIVFNALWYLYTSGIFVKNIINQDGINMITLYLTLLSIVSFIFFNLGYNFFSSSKLRVSDKKIDPFKIKIIVFLFFVLAIGVRLCIIYKIGFNEYLYVSRATRNSILANMNYLVMFSDLIYLTNVITLDLLFKTKSKFFFALFSTSFLFSLAMAVLEIDRSDFLKVILPVVFLLYYYKKINFKKIVIVGFILLLLFVNWKQFLNGIIFDNSMNRIAVTIPSELYTWHSIGNDVIRDLNDNKLNYLYGYTYYKALESIINPLFGNYESLSTWYVKNYHYDVYKKGGGYAFSAIIEAYYNFHIVGIIIFFYLFGLIIKKLELKVSVFTYRCLYALLLSVSYKLLRSEFYSIFKNAFWLWVVPLIVIYLFSKKNTIITRAFCKISFFERSTDYSKHPIGKF